jgi:hypothetical protein
VIYWNARHHWASFAFQAVRALPSADGGIDRVVESIVSQLGYLFPVFLVVLAIELLRALRAGPRSTNSWFFFCLAVPPIIVFTALNLFQRGLPHWTMSGWLFAFPLLGATVARFGVRGRVAAGWTVAVFGVLTIGIASLVAAHIRTAVVDRFSQKMLPLRGNAPDALLWSFLDWRDLRGALEERGFINGDTEFLVGFGDNAYRHLALAFDGEANVLCFCPSLQSQLRGTSDPSNFAGRMGIILYFPKEWNPALAGAAFERVEVLTPVQLVRDGVAVLEIGAARGYGLRPDALKGETGGS